MKHVELIRARILRGLVSEFVRLRVFISATEGNQEATDLLRGEKGDLLLAKTTDFIMRELGHAVETPVADKNSVVRRAVKRVRGHASE